MGETNIVRGPNFLGTEFNAFLFEPIGADDRGRQVTVVSALARLDMDPWAEADRLSRLPDETAERSVSTVLSRLPEIAVGVAEGRQIAQRLVRLLPKRLMGTQVASPFGRAGTPRALPLGVAAGMFCAIAFLCLSQIFMQSHQPGPAARQTSTAVQAVPPPALHGGN